MNAIGTRLLLDDAFAKEVLTGDRGSALASFSLTDQERIAILTINAEDPKSFMRELYRLMKSNLEGGASAGVEK
jgi:hypothetical protein